MHKYSGVILDFYDDGGATLKAKFPTTEDLPDTIKTASVQPCGELPLGAFALVAVDGSDVLRKFACNDAGTTAMSVIYLMEHGHKLPEDAVKVAAANLLESCLTHGMLPPAALTKMAKWYRYEGATGIPTFRAAGRKLTGAAAKDAKPGVVERSGEKLLAGAKKELAKPDTGKVVSDIGGKATAGAKKELAKPDTRHLVDVLGSRAASGAVRGAGKELSKNKAKIHKAIQEGSASAVKGGTDKLRSELRTPEMRAAAQEIGKDLGIGGSSKTKLKNVALLATVAGGAGMAGVAGGKVLARKAQEAGEGVAKNVVDITGGSTSKGKKKAASNYMYGQQFPIDSWDQVKKAESYLRENDRMLDPHVRRECAVKLASRAFEMGYPLDQELRDGGAPDFAEPGHLMAAIEMRKLACDGDEMFLYELFEKRAHMGPETYSECLRRFDIENGLDDAWNNQVPDPWRSTFGMDKTASVVWEDGADRVDEGQLENLAVNGKPLLMKTFTDALVTGFCSDPVGIFKSLPLGEKRTLARLAADVSADGTSEGEPKAAALGFGG